MLKQGFTFACDYRAVNPTAAFGSDHQGYYDNLDAAELLPRILHDDPLPHDEVPRAGKIMRTGVLVSALTNWQKNLNPSGQLFCSGGSDWKTRVPRRRFGFRVPPAGSSPCRGTVKILGRPWSYPTTRNFPGPICHQRGDPLACCERGGRALCRDRTGQVLGPAAEFDWSQHVPRCIDAHL